MEKPKRGGEKYSTSFESFLAGTGLDGTFVRILYLLQKRQDQRNLRLLQRGCRSDEEDIQEDEFRGMISE
jgi:hypothetical protein